MSFITPGSAPLLLKCSNKKTEYGLDVGMGPHGLYLRKVASHQYHPKGKRLSTATGKKKKKKSASSPFLHGNYFQELIFNFINIFPVRELSKLELGPTGSP